MIIFKKFKKKQGEFKELPLKTRRHYYLLAAILLGTFLLCASTSYWGLPVKWTNDEVYKSSGSVINNLLKNGSLNPNFFLYPTGHIYTLSIFAVLPTMFFVMPVGAILTHFDILTVNQFESVIAGSVILLSRLVSCLMGAGIVLLIYFFVRFK